MGLYGLLEMVTVNRSGEAGRRFALKLPEKTDVDGSRKTHSVAGLRFRNGDGWSSGNVLRLVYIDKKQA